jgi:hypothetical protein
MHSFVDCFEINIALVIFFLIAQNQHVPAGINFVGYTNFGYVDINGPIQVYHALRLLTLAWDGIRAFRAQS